MGFFSALFGGGTKKRRKRRPSHRRHRLSKRKLIPGWYTKVGSWRHFMGDHVTIYRKPKARTVVAFTARRRKMPDKIKKASSLRRYGWYLVTGRKRRN